MGKLAISAASTKVKSTVYVKAISPKNASSIGITLDKQSAYELATNLLVVCQNSDANGVIHVTGYSPNNKPHISIMKRKK